MAGFINKDVLVAEIKKRIKYYQAKNQISLILVLKHR